MEVTIIGIQLSKFIDGDILLKTEDVITRHTNDYSNEEHKFTWENDCFYWNDIPFPGPIFSPNYLITVQRFVPALKVGTTMAGTFFKGNLECYHLETLMSMDGDHTYEVAHFKTAEGMVMMFQIGALDTALGKEEVWFF